MSCETIQTCPNGILDPPGAVSVELVVHRNEDLGPRVLRRRHRRIGILDVERETHRRPAEGARLGRAEVGVVLGQKDRRVSDPDLGVDDASVRGGQPGSGLDRPECLVVEVERRFRADDGEVGGNMAGGHGMALQVRDELPTFCPELPCPVHRQRPTDTDNEVVSGQ